MIVTVPAAGQYGYLPDSVPQELPPNAWSYAQNMRYRDGYAERMRGESQVLNTPSITPYFITSYRNLNNKYWVYAGLNKVYVDDGVTKSDITPASAPTGAIDDRWSGGSVSGVLVLNNGRDQPIFWGGNTGTPFATLTGWNSAWRADVIRPFKNYLVALGITKTATVYSNMVKWSAASVPGSIPTSWDETDATKDAGEQDLAETTDALIDQLPLGDLNVIYKGRSMYGMQYIGGTFVFRFFRLPGEVGLLARGCVVNTPLGHVCLTNGDLVLHNGQGPQSIINARTRRWLFNSIDPSNYGRSFLCVNQPVNEVWVCFPESGHSACTKALVWNWKDDTFGVRQLSNATYGDSGPVSLSLTDTWNTDTEMWEQDTTTWDNEGFGAVESRLLLSQSTPLISIMETGGQIGGSTPTCIIERTGLAFDSPDIVKTVRSVTPRVDATVGTTLTIEVGGSMDAEVSPTWSMPVTYTVGSSRKADAFATGRFLAIRITSNTVQPWRIKSYDLDIVKRGRY